MRPFLDTNVLVYAMIEGPRSAIASQLLADGGVIGVQSLNEFTSVARRKLGFSFRRIGAAIEAITQLTGEPLPLTYGIHDSGRRLAELYGFSVYDSMLIAVALEAGCDRFYSEDMHHGLLVKQRLRIENPFA